MNDFVTRARNALERITANAEEGRHINGLLGRLNSDGSTTFTPVGLRNHKFVRIRNSSGSQTTIVARDDAGVPESSGLAVRLRVIHSVPNSGVVVYAIAGIVRDDALATMPAPPSGGVPAHIHDERYFREDEHINVSVGAADAAKPIVLNADGLIDPSMLNAGAGNALPYKFDTGTIGDPGSGHIRLNSATLTLASGINISDLDDNGTDVSTWLSLIGLAANLLSGYLHIWKQDDPSVFRMYGALNAQVDNTTYWTFTIAHIAGNGAFADEDDLWVSFTNSGDDGVHGGNSIAYIWDTATTDSDPGSGEIKANHATFASITQLFIDDNGYPNFDVQDWIATFDDSTSTIRGQIKITHILDQTDWMIFNVTGASVEATGYWKIAVTPVDSNGSFAANDRIVVAFTRTGDKGDAGDASDIAAEISGAAIDDSIADADLWGYVTGGVLVQTAWSNIKAVFKTYFDTLYGLLATANTWVQNQTIASTQTTGSALRVERDLASANTDAPVANIIQDNAGDDQTALRVQQDGTGAIANFFAAAASIFSVGATDATIGKWLTLTTASATIAGGVITATGSLMIVDTEAAAATDDLDTINGGAEGRILLMRTTNGTRDVTLKHATGNIRLPGSTDFTLNNRRTFVIGYYNAAEAVWVFETWLIG